MAINNLVLKLTVKKEENVCHITDVTDAAAAVAEAWDMARKLHNGGNGKSSLQLQMAPRTTDSIVDRLIDCTVLKYNFLLNERKKKNPQKQCF